MSGFCYEVFLKSKCMFFFTYGFVVNDHIDAQRISACLGVNLHITLKTLKFQIQIIRHVDK